MSHLAKHLTIALLLILSLAACSTVSAQVSTGTISGSVTDPTGAVVAGATVTATNLATNLAGTVRSNGSGLFTLPNLPAGDYRVSVAANGFSSLVVSDVTLDVGEQQSVNFSLKVGSATEKIEVTSAAPELDLVSAVTMPVVNQKTIVELPLNGRDWAALANLQPGVSAVRTQSVVAVSNQRANRGVGNQLTVSGARPQMNNYRIDGISINDYSNGGPGGVIGSNLGVDAIQEFSVITGNATADYGKTAGGIVNAVTRTGSNRFHGDVYEFFRNSALDARNEFDPAKIPPCAAISLAPPLVGPWCVTVPSSSAITRACAGSTARAQAARCHPRTLTTDCSSARRLLRARPRIRTASRPRAARRLPQAQVECSSLRSTRP